LKRWTAFSLLALLLLVSIDSSFHYAYAFHCGFSKDKYLMGEQPVVLWDGHYFDYITAALLLKLIPASGNNYQFNVPSELVRIGSYVIPHVFDMNDVGNWQVTITVSSPQLQYTEEYSCGGSQVVLLPIIFLPGIAGTELYSGNWEVWPLATGGSRFDLMLEDDGNTPAKLGVDIRTGSILRSSPANFYGGMIGYLTSLPCPSLPQKKCYREKENLFTYPYDWRLHLTEPFVGLHLLIEEALQKNPGAGKVILLAHSLGGVIARYYLLSIPADASKVDSLITMGSPFWGSPKAYYALVHGYNFDNPTVRQELMKVLAQNASAVYDLLPSAPFLYEGSLENVGTPASRALSLPDTYNVKYKGYDLSQIRRGIFRDTWYQSKDNIWSFTPGLLEQARKLLAIGGDRSNPTPLPTGVKHYAIYGYGPPTLCGFQMFPPILGEPYIEVAGRPLVGEPMFGTGDGTVPYAGYEISTATKHYYVNSAHGDLANNRQVQSIVGGIITGKPAEPSEIPFESTWRNTQCRSMFVRSQLFGDVTLDMLAFELHSAAHLTIMGPNGTLGFNSQGGIVESQPSATFLSMDGVEYAVITGLSGTYNVNVNGIDSGKFTLGVTIVKSGKSSTFSYSDVPVKNGTVAQVNINQTQITNSLPALQVTTDGKTTSVAAGGSSVTITTSTTTSPISPQIVILGLSTIALPIIGVIALIVFVVRRRRGGRRGGAAAELGVPSRPSPTPVPAVGGSKFCINCGVRIPAAYRFCGSCGSKQD
jgi:pimeloyl-ACP methyl ester carboxylesterase